MSERSKQDTIRGVQIRDGAVHIYWMYVWHNSSACHTYILWTELDHSHFCMGKHSMGGFTCQPF